MEPKGRQKGAKRSHRERKGSEKGAKWEPNGSQRVPKSNQNGAKWVSIWSKAPPEIPFPEQEWKSEEFCTKRVRQPSPFGSTFGPKSIKNAIENSFKNRSQIDAKTHQKPMPKVIAKKCVTIIEKRVFFTRVKTCFWAQNTVLLFKNKVREVW